MIPPSNDFRRAALLLEVVIALTIMVAAIGLLGAQLVNGLRMTAHGDLHTRAVELTDRILALLELDPQTQERVFLDEETEGDFGEQFRGWHWRVFVEETDVIGLGQVTIQILYQADAERHDDIDDAKVVREVHLLKADPGRIDLAEDFGVPEEVVDELLANFPAAGEDGTLDLQALLNEFSNDPLALLAFLAEIQQFLGDAGLGGGAGEAPSAEQLQQFFERFGGGVDPQALEDALGPGLPSIPRAPGDVPQIPRGGGPPGDGGGGGPR